METNHKDKNRYLLFGMFLGFILIFFGVIVFIVFSDNKSLAWTVGWTLLGVGIAMMFISFHKLIK